MRGKEKIEVLAGALLTHVHKSKVTPELYGLFDLPNYVGLDWI